MTVVTIIALTYGVSRCVAFILTEGPDVTKSCAAITRFDCQTEGELDDLPAKWARAAGMPED